MKIWPPRCEIALKDDEGMIRFGKTEWVSGARLACELDGAPAIGHVCDVSIRVTDLHTTIHASARVRKVVPGNLGQHRVLLVLVDLSDSARNTWEAWLASVSASMSRTPSGVSSGVSSMSLSRVRSGRRTVAKALREATPPPPVPIGRPSEASSSRAGSARSTWTGAGILHLRWTSASALRESLEQGLTRGRVKLADNPYDATEVHVTLHLPDGQVLSLPARIDGRGSIAPELRFDMKLALKQKLRRAARG